MPFLRIQNMPTDQDADDARDMEALSGGEDAALNRLMSRHRDKLFRYLVRSLQDESEALDLAQESFVRIYQNRAKFNPKHKFSTWLYTIATNLARDRMRWLVRHRHVSLDAPFGSAETRLGDALVEPDLHPGEQLEREERVAEIKRALAWLPEELRTPLVLSEYENLSHAEIGEILKCSPKAVETRIYRARKQLREELKSLLAL
jgi:RNA polymerase sigma-70 factor, ECF subfamily